MIKSERFFITVFLAIVLQKNLLHMKMNCFRKYGKITLVYIHVIYKVLHFIVNRNIS